MGLISTLLSPLRTVLKLIDLSVPILRFSTKYSSFYHIWYEQAKFSFQQYGFDINITVTAGNSAEANRPISSNINIFYHTY